MRRFLVGLLATIGFLTLLVGIVEAAGHASPVRTPRGRDILAACGQLKTASLRERRQRVAA